MERIVLNVNETIASKWRRASAEKRSKILAFFNNALDLIDEPTGSSVPQKGYGLPDEQTLQRNDEKVQSRLPAYTKLLDEMGEIAAKNGLTQEILDELLAKDD